MSLLVRRSHILSELSTPEEATQVPLELKSTKVSALEQQEEQTKALKKLTSA